MDGTQQSVSFQSAGETCRGDLYLPSGDANPPIVVMAHGFGGERTWRLPAYAKQFCKRGIATLLFDYRTFGTSDGKPQNLISPSAHLTDWRAAITYARSRPDIDSDRLALWGTSFSGGHVIETAASTADVSAVIAQIPFTDGIASTTTLLRQNGWRYLRNGMRAVLKDLKSMVMRQGPYYVPLVNEPGEFALLNTPDAKTGVEAIVPDNAQFQNECPARIIAEIPGYRPVTSASDVSAPVLVIQAADDLIIPPWSVDRLVYELNDVQRIRVSAGHFDVYHGSLFKQLVERQLGFLNQHLSQ